MHLRGDALCFRGHASATRERSTGQFTISPSPDRRQPAAPARQGPGDGILAAFMCSSCSALSSAQTAFFPLFFSISFREESDRIRTGCCGNKDALQKGIQTRSSTQMNFARHEACTPIATRIMPHRSHLQPPRRPTGVQRSRITSSCSPAKTNILLPLAVLANRRFRARNTYIDSAQPPRSARQRTRSFAKRHPMPARGFSNP